MTLNDFVYQQELREQFLQKLIDNWEAHFARHGESFVNLTAIRNKNGFVEDVCDVVETALAEQVGAVEARRLTPSKDTFRRLLFEYEVGNRWQSRTRHALCQYVGFTDWEIFKDDVRERLKHEPVTVNINQIMVRPAWLPIRPVWQALPEPTLSTNQKRFGKRWLIAALAGLLVTAGLHLSWRYWQNRPFTAEQLAGVRFNIERTEGKGLPQMLLLHYDVQSLEVDSVRVDFSTVDGEYNHHPGDLTQIVQHQPQGRFTYPFWKPAFCVIRLLARDQEVARLYHTTRSDGWLGWTKEPKNGATQALPQAEIQTDGRLKVPLSARKGEPGDYFSHLVNQRPFGLDADEMDLQVRLKNPFAEGGISCFEPSLTVRWGGGQDQALSVQTSRIGCGASTRINFGKQAIQNGETDLSGLSSDFETWRTLRIRTQNRVAYFYIDNQLAHQHPYTSNLGVIQALEIGFKGSGSVDWMQLTNSRTGKDVYKEDF